MNNFGGNAQIVGLDADEFDDVIVSDIDVAEPVWQAQGTRLALLQSTVPTPPLGVDIADPIQQDRPWNIPGTYDAVALTLVQGELPSIWVGSVEGNKLFVVAESANDCNSDGLGDQCQCPEAGIVSSVPVDGVVDARYPHDTADANALLGIDSVTVVLDTEESAIDPTCWALCETAEYPSNPNGITSVTLTMTAGGFSWYQLALTRPLTAGAVTTINYINDPSPVTFFAHPANVDGNGASNGTDILNIIDCLNGVNTEVTCPWGEYSSEVDHSGQANATDTLAVIDLLNGAGEFQEWNNTALPVNATCTSVCDTFAGFGGAAAQSSGGSTSSLLSLTEGGAVRRSINSELADGFVRYMATNTVSTSVERESARVAIEGLTGWCVDHFTSDERDALADRLTDANLIFADDWIKAHVTGVAVALRDSVNLPE